MIELFFLTAKAEQKDVRGKGKRKGKGKEGKRGKRGIKKEKERNKLSPFFSSQTFALQHPPSVLHPGVSRGNRRDPC